MTAVVHAERLLELARQRLPEIAFAELDVIQTGIDKWSFVDRRSGVEYRRVDYNPGVSDLPSSIVAFTIGAGGRIHFLRKRGIPA
jgi:hypothetical protein